MLGDKETNIKIGGDFDPIPMDKYTVQIADVNLKTQFNKFKGVDQELLVYQYVILDEKAMPEGDETTRGRLLWHRMTQNLSSKSWLMKLARAVYGRDLTREELEAFDPEALIGKQIDVMVEQKPSTDGSTIYNNVVSYSKVVTPLEPWAIDNTASVTVERESTPATLPTPIEKTVKLPDLDSDFEDAFAKPKVTKKVKVKEEDEDEEVDDDEIAKIEADLKKAKAKAKAKKTKTKTKVKAHEVIKN